ncbi:MAG: pentapeptide repeat-containing protein, partial [Actinomycetota bacterium]
EQRSYGDTRSATIAIALENAGKLRDQPQSRKIRQSPNLRRTRLEVLATQWGTSVAILIELGGIIRITIHDPESPRISNDDLLKLRAALQAATTVTERWGEQADVRLSKVATYCHVSLQELRKRCETLDVHILKRERISRDDAVYLLVELGQVHHARPDAHSTDVPENAAGSVHDDSPSAKEVDLRLDGLELTDQDFSFEVLVGASFRGCELTRANFTGANLTGADFSGAILRYAVFEQALLDDALFDKADVRFANFAGVVLSEAQLTSALFEGASFGGDTRP